MVKKQTNGSVMVIGGGIAGIQASLDLADSGYLVYMIEKSSSIGGSMTQLDKTFPTNDCSMCIISPKLVEAGRHLNIKLLTLTEVISIRGNAGNFLVKLKQEPRFVDMQKCIACGLCSEKCPKKVDDEYNQALIKRKAIYLQYAQAVPLKYAIDLKHCIYFKNGKCRACEKFCPANAINFNDKSKEITLNIGSVILAPGFKPFDPSRFDMYGYSQHPNVITSIEMERILSASGPTQGHLIRPSDHKEPQKIAWLQCVGSRDINICDNEYCSSVCCMYANKQAMIAQEHSHSGNQLGTVIFFMDMRTFGKDFDKYALRGQERNGIRHIRSRVHSVFPTENDQLRIVYSSEAGGSIEETFDLVVLSIGLASSKDAIKIAKAAEIELNSNNFAKTNNLSPIATNRNGIYVCGAFQEPKDIPLSVMEASAAAAAAAELLSDSRWTLTRKKEAPPEIDIAEDEPRIGVFVCNCGINIGGIADVPAIRDYAATLPYVVHVEDRLFACSQDSQNYIKETIIEKRINRVVVASCSPRTHEPLFQETIRDAGLNKYLFEMANIRDQNTWVHMNAPAKATQKAKELVHMAVINASHVEPLHQINLTITKRALILGGGISGMEAALSIAEQGCEVVLVEKSKKLGGNASHLRYTWQNEHIPSHVKKIIDRTQSHKFIKVYTETEVVKTSGVIGNFKTTLVSTIQSNRKKIVEHGATIIAIGAQESKPVDYLYGTNSNVFTHLDFDSIISEENLQLSNSKTIAFIQCVGSRNENRPYCSKVCCTQSLKSAIFLKKLNPNRKIIIIYRDIRSYGFREQLFREARELGVLFVRYNLENTPKIYEFEDGKIKLTVTDHVLCEEIEIKLDMLVLATGISANKNENEKLSKIFKIPTNNDGFFLEAHAKLKPVDFPSEGIFLAGLAHYPKPIEESITQAKASAARAMTVLSKDSIATGGIVAEIDATKCAACLTCLRTCPYKTPSIEEHSYAIIETAQCHGCGICVSECPSKAISLKHFTDKQLIAKASALFSTNYIVSPPLI